MSASAVRGRRVTVVVPTFRRPDLLRRCIAACDAQSLPSSVSFDVVVVDNCPERSAEAAVAAFVSEAVHPVSYVSEPRPGISYARNAGLLRASGEFVAFIDDDEVPGPQWISELLNAADQHNADAVLAPVVPFAQLRGETAEVWPPTGTVLGSTTVSPFWARTGKSYPRLATNNVLLRVTSEAVSGVMFDHRLGLTGGEDTVYFNTIIGRGAKLVSCAEAEVHEHIGLERRTLRYAVMRSFRGGQIVSWAPMLARPPRPMLTGISMLVGLAQAPAFLALAGWGYVFRRAGWECHLRRLAAALGKLLWGAPFRYRAYGASAMPQT